jgi:tetratricopeptide (TPR) repeat protein
MNHWHVLNITETDDKDAVKRAYMAALKQHNPEDDPEGFARVRAAYEQALAEIDGKNAESAEDNSPIGLFMKKVAALYKDFGQRREAANWQELLKDDVCLRLDTEDEVGERLLIFFMDNYFLPSAVWLALGNHFGWPDKKAELKKTFPANYIDYIIRHMHYEWPRYDLFDAQAGADIDRFIYLFYLADQQLDTGEKAGLEESLAELAAMGIEHADYDMLKARKLVAEDKKEEALALAEPVYRQRPEDVNIAFTYAQILQSLHTEEHTKAALDVFRQTVATYPSHFGATMGTAECLAELEDYDGARTILRQARMDFPANLYVVSFFQSVSEKLAEIYEAKHAENPSDFAVAKALAKHLLNTDRYEDCYKLLQKFPHQEDDADYCEYLGACFSQREEHNKAAEYMLRAAEREKTARAYCNLADMLILANRFAEAIKYAEEGLALAEGDAFYQASLHFCIGKAHEAVKEYSKALAAYDLGIAANYDLQPLHIRKAFVLKETGDYAEAMDSCERAIALIVYNPIPYEIEMDVFIEVGNPENALEVYQRAMDLDVDTLELRLLKAQALLKLTEEDRQGEAMSILDDLLADDSEDELFKLTPEKCARILAARGEIFIAREEYENAERSFKAAFATGAAEEKAYDLLIDLFYKIGDYPAALECVKAELKKYDNAENRLRLAWLHRELGSMRRARLTLEKTARDFQGHERTHRRLAEFYENIGAHKKALKQYEIILRADSDRPDIHDDIAYNLAALRRFDEALELLGREIEKYPDYLYLYARRGGIYLDSCQPEKAATDLLKAVSSPDELEYWRIEVVYNRLGHLYEGWLNDAMAGEKYYKLALDADENEGYDTAYANLCLGDIAMYYHKNFAMAITYYNAKQRLEPDDAKSYLKLAQALDMETPSDLKREYPPAKTYYKKALAMYKKQLAANPYNPCLNCYTAECCLGLGQHKKALYYYNIAIKTAPGHATCPPRLCHEAFFGICKIYAEKGDYEKAREYLEKAIEIANGAEYNKFREELLLLKP